MAALGWLINLDFAASGGITRFGAYIDGLTVSRSGGTDMAIDAAGYVDGGCVEPSGTIDGVTIAPSGTISGGRVRKSGGIDGLKIQPRR